MTSKSITASQLVQIPNTQFQYTTAPLAVFEESQYTVVGITRDKSGSVFGVRGDIFAMDEFVDTDLKNGASKHTIQVRRTDFTDIYTNNVNELHGFLPPLAINPQIHFPIDSEYRNYGGTPLFDGSLEALIAAKTQASMLINQQGVPLVNIVVPMITDGGDTGSNASPEDFKAAVEQILAEGEIESVFTLLIGVGCGPKGNRNSLYDRLLEFQRRAGLSAFIPFDEASKGVFGKAARMISKSIGGASKQLATGKPSQVLQTLQAKTGSAVNDEDLTV